jgi:hypothetical protein
VPGYAMDRFKHADLLFSPRLDQHSLVPMIFSISRDL